MLINNLKLSKDHIPASQPRDVTYGNAASEQTGSTQHCCRFLQEDSYLSTNLSSHRHTTKGQNTTGIHLAVGQVVTSEGYNSLFRFYFKKQHGVSTDTHGTRFGLDI